MSFSPVYKSRVLDPSYTNWLRLFQEDAMRVHKAHLVMLAEQRLIPARAVTAIRKGIDTLSAAFRPPEILPDGVEDLYFLFERSLADLIGIHHAGYLHTARSRNDMDTTVFRLGLARKLIEMLSLLSDSFDAILERARGSTSLPIVLYTHGQPANVSTLSHYLSAILLDLIEDGRLMLAALGEVDRSTMGACAITTTGFAIDRARVSRLLGCVDPVPNSYQAISTSHWLTFPASACSSLMTDITRFAADLGHKASCEVGMVTFPDELVQVSSIMPQKRNPVIIEHMRIQAGLARGGFAAVVELFGNVPYQDVNEVADAPVAEMLDAIDIARSAIELLTETVRHIGVDGGRVRRIAAETGVTTTELADTLVRECGISFREAHSVTQTFVRSGYEKAALRSAFHELRGTDLPYSDERIDEILSPDWFIAVRRVPGGPAPEGMESVLQIAHAETRAIHDALAGMRERKRKADGELDAAFRAL